MHRSMAPIISIVGWANSGKTTFLEKLVVEMKARGVKVGVIKHHHGFFDIDQPGKDTWRMFQAGAECTAIAGPGKIGLVMRVESECRPNDIAALMPNVDLVLTEGYKQESYPQIEVRGPACKEENPASRAGRLVALVGNHSSGAGGVPCYSRDDAAGVAKFIIERFMIKP